MLSTSVLIVVFLLILVVVEVASIMVADKLVDVNDPKRESYQITAIIVGIVISALIGGLLYYLVNRKSQSITIPSLPSLPSPLPAKSPTVEQPALTAADIQNLVELSRTIR